MEEVYAYRLSGRRRMVWLALSLFLLLVMLLLARAAPLYIWFVWLPCGAMILYFLIKNPSHGVRLMQDRLILSAWQNPREVALEDIRRIEFVEWSDGSDMEVYLRDGDVIRVFSGDIPPRAPFIASLRAVGVPVEAG